MILIHNYDSSFSDIFNKISFVVSASCQRCSLVEGTLKYLDHSITPCERCLDIHINEYDSDHHKVLALDQTRVCELEESIKSKAIKE